jgi:hypothetical protein
VRRTISFVVNAKRPRQVQCLVAGLTNPLVQQTLMGEAIATAAVGFLV